jgi:hypothetical protein
MANGKVSALADVKASAMADVGAAGAAVAVDAAVSRAKVDNAKEDLANRAKARRNLRRTPRPNIWSPTKTMMAVRQKRRALRHAAKAPRPIAKAPIRRGGRRNRGRNGEAPAPYNPNEAAPDPSLEAAVADLDKPPAYQAPAYSPPVAAPAEAPTASYAPQEPPRRRSTIREPAPIGAAAPASNLPPPTPVISVTATTEPVTPKRGWWGKRLLGDKE